MPVRTRSGNYRATIHSTQRHASGPFKVVAAPEKNLGNSRSNDNRKGAPNAAHNLGATSSCKRSRNEGADSETSPSSGVSACAAATSSVVLVRIPADIFIEIAKYLHPLDLLILSRVNKFLRELFMSRWATPIWRSARLSIPELPSRPACICEPQYAALLFTKTCSTCGRQTSRKMDAILLVRLCARCYDEQAIDASLVMDRSLVFVSYDPVPGRDRSTNWCLNGDVQAVDSRLKGLDAAGDTGAMAHWIQERQKEVNRRYWHAQPLRQWLGICTHRGEEEMIQYSSARQLEIKVRVAELGWEEADFTSSESRRDNQLKFLMRDTERLTDKVWEELLPKLLAYLQPNREARLQREMTARKYEREIILKDYMYAIKEQLWPFARVISESRSPSLSSVGASWHFEHNKMLLANSFPSVHQAYLWPELRTLLDTDMPTSSFRNKLVEQQGIIQILITDWQRAVEASLVTLLPEDTRPLQSDRPLGFVTMINAGGDMDLISNLPASLQKLLRADSIFMGQDRLRFYPDDFVNTSLNASNVTYHAQAASIAKALLSALNRPDASYLELKALGRAFHCGRCHSPPRYMTWYEMVQHYLTEADTWYQHSVAREVCEAKDFTLVFAHDVDVVNPSRPLVLVQTEHNRNMFPGYHGSTRRCKVCQSVLIRRWYHAEHIVDHVRDVHLIEEPKQGLHYSQ